MIVAVDVGKQIVDQRVEGLRWGWDERRGARVATAAADPVLDGADHASGTRNRRPLHQGSVDADEVGRKGELPTDERVGEVGVVVTSLTVAATHPLERGGPTAAEQLPHNVCPSAI
jgi:hypothetical protein